jgi:hypothetical protein
MELLGLLGAAGVEDLGRAPAPLLVARRDHRPVDRLAAPVGLVLLVLLVLLLGGWVAGSTRSR